MEDLFLKFKSDNNDEFSQALDTFINNYTSVTKFEFLDKKNFRSEIWEDVFLHLRDENQYSIHEKCLAALRILSRDKSNLNNILSKEKLDVILKYAGLNSIQNKYKIDLVTNEAQRLLSNLLFNSSKVQNLIVETKCLETVIDRIRKYDKSIHHHTKLFDVRIIFLITAFNTPTRNYVSNKLHGDIELITMLEDILKDDSVNTRKIKDDNAILSCEILKALFNLFSQPKDTCSRESEAYKKMVLILRKLLLCENEKYKENVQSNIVNLLTEIPNNCYTQLIIPLAYDQNNIILYQNMDMTIINMLIKFLNKRIDYKIDMQENLAPVLKCFIKICRAEKLIRKYVRMQILPPLKDVMKRPEEGSTLRNKLCKLLTSSIIDVRDLVAEFLFILCKEKVGRMIKYTGYGNAAGMFANKGLLGPDQSKVDYSSESEDSETEEYQRFKEQINPVIGCYEDPKLNPLDGMSEEQKEYEAMKLVGLVDQLQRDGLIKPCRIGEDGKPQAIEHVLELKEHLPKQQLHRQDSDSD